MPKRWGFTYLFCDDLQAMKRFYSGVLGLTQIWEDDGSIAYDIAGHQLAITFDEGFRRPAGGFARQPGWQGGSEPRTSWSLECDAADYKQIVANVNDAEAAPGDRTVSFWREPRWVGYWSLPLLDPMGNTIEVTCSAEDLG